MVEFNPDGSIKLTGRIAKIDEEQKNRLRFQRCIKIKKEVVSTTAPKKCVLHFTISDAIKDIRFVGNLYNYFKETAEVPTKFIKLNDKEFQIEIGTNFRRCSDCNSLIGKYREFLDGNIVEETGACTFKGNTNFSYEDYFD